MNVWIYCGLLFFIPVATLSGAVGSYLISYGKHIDETILAYATPLLIISLIISSFFSYQVVNIFSQHSGDMKSFLIYSGMTLSVLAWVINTTIVGVLLYLTHSVI